MIARRANQSNDGMHLLDGPLVHGGNEDVEGSDGMGSVSHHFTASRVQEFKVPNPPHSKEVVNHTECVCRTLRAKGMCILA